MFAFISLSVINISLPIIKLNWTIGKEHIYFTTAKTISCVFPKSIVKMHAISSSSRSSITSAPWVKSGNLNIVTVPPTVSSSLSWFSFAVSQQSSNTMFIIYKRYVEKIKITSTLVKSSVISGRKHFLIFCLLSIGCEFVGVYLDHSRGSDGTQDGDCQGNIHHHQHSYGPPVLSLCCHQTPCQQQHYWKW